MSHIKNSETSPLKTEQDQSVGCCGGPATNNADACCVKDAQAKAAGKAGCGCNCSEQ